METRVAGINIKLKKVCFRHKKFDFMINITFVLIKISLLNHDPNMKPKK